MSAEGQATEGESTPSKAHAAESVERWLFLGDSLTAGYGLSPDESYVAVLEARLRREGWRGATGHPVKLINAGISGDTSAGALRRVDWLLGGEPVHRMFLCIGANDGLRGQPTEALERNLSEIIQRAQRAGVKVALMGMKLPPNYGERYAQAFTQVYPRVATAQGVSLLPFLLEGVAGDPALNLPDGIHPNREGQERVAAHVFDFSRAQGFIRLEPSRAEGAP